MTGPEWRRPPLDPALAPGEAAVWRLDRGAARPIERVVARYLGVRPDTVRVERTRTGKPELVGAPFRVGLAHSGETALVALARETEIGVDVELRREGIEGWTLPAHVLTEAERTRLEQGPVPERADRFLSVWTRKEALLKAVGVGLALDPRLVELDGLTLVVLPPELGDPCDWTLADLPLPGYVASVALRGPLSKLALYDAT